MTPTQLKKGFRIGSRRVLPMEGSIISGGARHHLRPKTMDVLVQLASRPYDVIPRDDLLNAVWGDQHTGEDAALTRCIHDLRRCLGDDPRSPEIIRTVPKRGYLLSAKPAPLTRRDHGKHSHAGAYAVIGVLIATAVGALLWFTGYRSLPEVADVVPDRGSIAVVPFRDLNGDESDIWFAEGFSEDLLRELASIPDLHVSARLSSFQFQEGQEDYRVIGETLDVDTLLTGTLERIDESLRVNARLVDANTGYQLWTETYDRATGDIFEIQESIATAVIGTLKPQISDEPPALYRATDNLEAYDLYVLGRFHLHRRTQESLERAIEMFEAAVALDESFALAWSGIADSHALLVSYAGSPREESRRAAKRAVDRALALAPQLAETHASLGLYRLRFGNAMDALEPLKRAVELNPNYSMVYVWLSGLYVLEGRLSEALHWNEAALSLDPLHPTVNQNMYLLAAWTGDTDKAARFQRRLMRIDPDNLAHHRLFAEVAVDYGHYAAGVDWAMRVLEELPDDFLALIQLGRAYTFLGRFERAQPVLEKARELAPDNADVIRANSLYYLASDRLQELADYAAQVLQSFPSRGRPTQQSPAQVARVWAGLASFAKGNYQRAREHLELGLDSSLPNPDYPNFAPLLAATYLKLGLRDHAARTLVEANAVSERLRKDGLAVPELMVARAAISVVEQEPTKAMSLLIEASQAGWLGYWALVNDPRFGPLRDDAGFQQFMLTLREEVDLQSAQVLARN